MTRTGFALLAAALAAPAALGADACGYGTRVDFVDTPKEAAKIAAKEEKLVFVLHVSGHFENPGLT
jgi:hypothetical protein